ncbi:hypothetical protein UVI_02035630 [Ustilaginoidea virens]|nr:hypothetical protein UVI_02035630 [Ustilaginoidea virens]
MQPFYRSPLVVDTRHAQQKYFKEDDRGGMLEDGSLEHGTIDSGLELSPPMINSRRESFAMGTTLFSPKAEDWQSVDMQSVPSNPFADQSGGNNAPNLNPFMRLDPSHGHVFSPQASPWDVNNTAGSHNVMHQFNHVQGAFDASASIFQRPVQNHNPFSNAGAMFAALGNEDQPLPTSPEKEWMLPVQTLSKKMQPGSPMIRSHNELRRGDGIRKKNARFEIPVERNLSNIDSLIAQSTDDQEIKELKQQKRLLRNRQAALDSRQRKKQHTERLEDEKKQFTSVISDMEEEVASLKEKFDMLMQEKNSLVGYIDRLTMEKDDMIRTHTLESGELRKKVNVLTEHVQRLESQTLIASGPGGNDGYSDSYDGMEGIGMPGSWDSSTFAHEYSAEQPKSRHQMSLVPAKKSSENTASSECDKGSSQGGLLFMLFLVGAFVMSSRSTPAIPRVSEDVRAASATLLDNVLKDAGISSQATGIQAIPPQPSGSEWIHTGISDISMDTGTSMLEELGDSLTQPSQEQMNEHIFSLSAAQYDGVSNHEFLQNAPNAPGRSTSQGRRNLAEALAAMRVASKHDGAAEVYTRSLLWDQIPNDVVRNFAKMVAESNNAHDEQECDEA